tara:strand:- start:116 stop:2227 length:2112 start_codon:yes stop_codon:yes gene_type:complete
MNIISINHIYKIFLIFLAVLIIGIPIDRLPYLFLFLISFAIIILSKLKKKIQFNKIILVSTFVIIIKLLIPNINIQEGHNLIVLNQHSKNFYKDNLPEEIYKYVENNFEIYYSKSTCSESTSFCWKYFDPNNELSNSSFSNDIYAFSSKWNLKEKKYSRILNNIDFKNLKTAKIETINNLNFNFVFPKTYDMSRENIPFFVMIEIPDNMLGNSICWKGQTFWENKNQNYENKFNSEYQCTIINENNINKKIFGVSFGGNENIERLNELYDDSYVKIDDKELKNFLEKNELQFKIKKNNLYLFYDFFTFFVTIISLMAIIYFGLNCDIKFFTFNFFYTIIFLLIGYYVHEDLINGFTIYLGGMDGLIYSSYANKMFYELQNLNFYEYFKGAESIFYFMPGIRYFFSLNKFLFGESHYGHLLVAYFYPIVVFFLLNYLVGFNYSIVFTTLFFITKLFDGYAFSLITFLEHIKEGDSEPLSIFLLLFSLLLFVKVFKQENLNKNLFLYFILGISLFASTAIRPNFLPGSLFILFSTSLYLYFKNKNYIFILSLIFGYSFIFLLPIHNYYYGSKFYFFTSGVNIYNYIPIKLWFNFIFDILTFDYNNFGEKYSPVLNQINRWIKPEQIHFIITFSIVILTLFSKSKLYIKCICIVCLLQHMICLYIIPDSRYAYLAWILTIIINIHFFRNLFNLATKALREKYLLKG